MPTIYDRRDFFKTAGGTRALLLSARGLTAAQAPTQESPGRSTSWFRRDRPGLVGS
jgi:hypothetical protein